MNNPMRHSFAAIAFLIVLGVDAAPPALAQSVPAVPILVDRSVTAELAYWNTIKDSANPDDYRTYLENFPDGMFFDPALEKFEQAGGRKQDLSAKALMSTAALEPESEPVVIAKPQPVPAKKIAAKPAKKKVVKKTRKKVVASKTRKAKCGTKGAPACVATVAKKKPLKKKLQVIPGDGGSGGGSSSGGGSGWGG